MAHRLITGLLIPVSIAALAFGVISFTRTNDPPRGMTRAARIELQSMRTEIAGLRSEDHTLITQAANVTKGGGKLSSTVAKIVACLPELTSYVNGLTPSVSNGQVSLNNTQQISHYCSKLLYGF